MDASIIKKIMGNKLFQNVNFDGLSFNNIQGNVCILNQGELLYREGENNTSLFLIVRGEINLIPSQFNSANDSVIYSENDFFGVNEFITEMPRGESAIAIRDTYLIELSKEEVNSLINQNSEILTNIYSSSKQTETGYNPEPNTSLEFPKEEQNLSELSTNNIAATDELPLSEFEEETDIHEKETIEKIFAPETPVTEEKSREISPAENVPTQNSLSTEMTFEQLDRINKAAHLVNSNVKIDDVLKNIVDVSVALCDAERGTLYLVDKSKNELWSKVLQGNEPRKITLKIGTGLAGWAAANKTVVNVPDASKDDRFNDTFDKSSGFKTKTVLCFPIKNKNDDVVGVIQLLNSKKGAFTKLDENFLYALSTHAALALQNADLVEQLLKTERISSLGKMANFLIQDIKKPILVSKRYAEHLKKKELAPNIEQVVDMLLEQLNNIADLVESTSNYSEGKSVLRSSEINLNELLNDFTERISSYVHSMNCAIVKNYDADVRVNIDLKEFYQAFKHIIKNACEAMPNGGDIEIATKIDNNKVKLTIKDNGLGIPPGFEEKIFEPFMSYGKKNGTGLGLSVTKKIIEEHEGTIKAGSNMGIGTSIIITLPTA